MSKNQGIKAIDNESVHRITSGQVVIDLQTAVKELLENSIDAGATNIEVRFKNYGLTSIEVLDNGSGIAEEDHDSIALKHHTSKLKSFTDLTSVRTFGFRGEALSSLCALTEELVVCTATSTTAPMGVKLVMHSSGKVKEKSTAARTRGTTIILTKLFTPLPVRRKEFERNAKREFGKALALLNAYALVPCAAPPGVRLTVSNQPDKGPKSIQIRTLGSPSCRDSVTSLWGSRALENIIDMNLEFEVEKEKATLKRLQNLDHEPVSVRVKGLISKFSMGCGRTGTDRQYFFVNGRPCNMSKVQKVFNEVYRSFNTNQAPFILADFIVPTESYDVNVSPDKRTILLHSEGNLLAALKAAIELHFSPSRSTFDLGGGTQSKSKTRTQTLLTQSALQPTEPPDTSTAGLSETQRSPRRLEKTHGQHSVVEQPSFDQTSEEAQPVVTAATSSPPVIENETLAQSISLSNSISASLTHSTPLQPLSGDEPAVMLSQPPIDTMPDGEQFEEPDDTPVVLDTSQTPWGRKLGLTPRSSRLSSSSSEPDGRAVRSNDEDEDNARHVQKKRKTDNGLFIVDKGGTDHVQGHEEDELSSAESMQDAIKSIPLPRPRGGRSEKASGGRTPAQKASRTSRLNLRGQLAGFARTGSQSAQSQAARSIFDEEANQEHDGDDAEVEAEEVQSDEELEDKGDEAELESDSRQMLESRVGDLEAVMLKTSEHGSTSKPPEVDKSSTTITDSSNLTPLFLEDDDDDTEDASSILNQVRATSKSPMKITRKNAVNRPEVIKIDRDGRNITLQVDIDRIKNVWMTKHREETRLGVNRGLSESGDTIPCLAVDASISNTDNDARAVDALSRVIDKKDFAEMEVVGQFNLGFVIVRRRQRHSRAGNDCDGLNSGSGSLDNDQALDDLFIVDQHAADEKYNFETLQATTKIQSQRLFRPRSLELTASDEMTAIENIDVLRQNGFEIEVEEENSQSHGSRLKLTAQPVSKSTVFDMKDLEEIIHLMRDRPGGQMVRCSKARTMFASRACRKSVMIGMPLNQQQMTNVIRHMGTMDQPWNCPHGRPTMRHLFDIRMSGSKSKDSVDWSSIS